MPTAPFRNQPILTYAELEARLDEFYAAVDEFNDGYYFESHETLEDLWMVTPWPERQFFQAIIQIAAAFVHLARGEYPGILKLLDAALDKLQEFAPSRFGVDVSRLVAEVEAARSGIAQTDPEKLAEWDDAAVPRIIYRRERGAARRARNKHPMESQ